MKYGHFDDTSREYVIDTPSTPYPWINYLGTRDFFSLISNTAGGYSFYKDARLRRITRYRYNDIPVDSNGRYFYINDGGVIWSPGYKPVKTALDFYECRHGLGYTVIQGRKNGLEAAALYMVPTDGNCELQRLTLTNRSQQPKTFSVFSFVEFCFWNAVDDSANFQRNFSTGEVEIEGSTICHITEYRERRNHFAFYHVNEVVAGFDSDRDAFLGAMNGLDAPAAVVENRARGSVAAGWSPVASHQVQVTLGPGETKELIYILGYVENPDSEKFDASGRVNKARAHTLIARYDTPDKFDRALAALKKEWDALLSKYTIQSGEEKLDRMVNIWNPYQCMVTFNLSRSASYFESGIGRGMGFRDSSQDILGFVHQIPDSARDRIIDLASTQLEDGGAYHQYQPLTKKGNDEIGGNFNDDPLWLIYAVAAYIKETGDFSILSIQVPFNNDRKNTSTLFEHCKRSFYHVVNNLGPHGLPLIGRADWNDCLNLNCFSMEPDQSFQTYGSGDGRVAESVLIAAMFILIGREFSQLCTWFGFKMEAAKADKHIEKMMQAVLRHGYDGEWFLRAYDNDGGKVGSHENEEGKIYIESQGFCVMAGVGVKTGEAEKALDSVRKYLDTKYGIVLLNPAYTKYHPELGEITSYPPGYKENAGIFCHNNPWVIAAETVLGRGDRAFEYYKKIAPAYVEDISDVHKTEPYVYSQMIAGEDAVRFGEAKNSWLTGTAAWNFFVISQWILGIKPDYDGLCVDPCIPSTMESYHVSRLFRGVRYEITVKNPNHVSRGVQSVTVDRTPYEGRVLPLFAEGTHEVEVVLG